jgi:hypothetical protein
MDFSDHVAGTFSTTKTFEVQSDGIVVMLRMRLRIGAGYGLPWAEVSPFVAERRVCFGSGEGASLVLADAGRRLTVAHMMNKMAPWPSVTLIAGALVERVCDIVNRLSGPWCRRLSTYGEGND